ECRNPGWSGDCDFIHAVAVHHPCAVRAKSTQSLSKRFRPLPVVDADELSAHACRIRQRSKQIENSAKSEFTPHRCGMFHRRVESLREKKTQTRLTQAPRRALRTKIDAHSQRFKTIRGTAFR